MDRAGASDEVAVAAAGNGDPEDAGDWFLNMDAKSGPEDSGDASKGASLSSVRRERKGEAVALPIEPKLLSIVLLLTRVRQHNKRDQCIYIERGLVPALGGRVVRDAVGQEVRHGAVALRVAHGVRSVRPLRLAR